MRRGLRLRLRDPTAAVWGWHFGVATFWCANSSRENTSGRSMISHIIEGGIALPELFIHNHLQQVVYHLKIVVSVECILVTYCKFLGFCSSVRKKLMQLRAWSLQHLWVLSKVLKGPDYLQAMVGKITSNDGSEMFSSSPASLRKGLK